MYLVLMTPPGRGAEGFTNVSVRRPVASSTVEWTRVAGPGRIILLSFNLLRGGARGGFLVWVGELKLGGGREKPTNRLTPDIINNRRRALLAVTAAKVTEHER